MKRSLYLLRHAKSDWDADYEDDRERPLAARGRRAADAVGRWWREAGPAPQAVRVSSAVRAQQTWDRVREAAGWTLDAETRPELYGAGPAELGDVAASAPASLESLLIVAHEPGLSMWIEALTGAESVRFPTAAFARLDLLGAGWGVVREPAQATLRVLITPKWLGVRKARGRRT